jgi:uncharacterized membrane protein
VIRLFNLPALTWTLTAVLLAGGSYHLLQAARSHHLTDRINNTLHALMNALMAAMLWNLAPSIMLAQIGLLAGAALWFVIQAVARPEFKRLCATTQGRLKCAYHGFTMAAGAVMIASMAGHAPANGPANPTSVPMPHAHHSMAHGPHTTTDTATTTAAALGNAPAILLTLFFAAAATTFLILLLRQRVTTHRQAARKHSSRTINGIEASGAATMALMFTTMIA